MIRFKDWLGEQRERDDPVGDLARDAHEDAEFPDDVDEVIHHLRSRGAIVAALNAAQRGIKEWSDAGNREVIEVTIRFRLNGKMQMAGLRQGWISADLPDGRTAELASEAGLGGSGVWFSMQREPGKPGHDYWGATLAPAFRTLIEETR